MCCTGQAGALVGHSIAVKALTSDFRKAQQPRKHSTLYVFLNMFMEQILYLKLITKNICIKELNLTYQLRLSKAKCEQVAGNCPLSSFNESHWLCCLCWFSLWAEWINLFLILHEWSDMKKHIITSSYWSPISLIRSQSKTVFNTSSVVSQVKCLVT